MKNKVILLASDQLGNGEKELGEGILETFFTILKQKEELPLQLADLEKKGVDVLACKTCVDYYELNEKLVTGKVSGMAQFVELASEYEVITIS